MHRKMVKSDFISGLISGGHIRPDMTGYENSAGFRPGPGPDMISGATLIIINIDGEALDYTAIVVRAFLCMVKFVNHF